MPRAVDSARRVAAWPLAIGHFAAVALLLVVPLVWTTGVTNPSRTPQRELTLATLGVLAAAALALPGLRRRLADGWSLAWAGVLAAGVVAALANPHPALALAGLVPLLLAALASLTLRLDRRILETIVDSFQGGPVGIETLAASMGEDKDTLEDVYEPYLIQQGYLCRTARGRTATEAAYRHVGRTPQRQGTLL